MTTILVIDDDDDLRETSIDLLMLEGYDVHEATDGFEGLQLAREILPDLILCDITMPELNGFEVLEELRQDSSTTSIPFIFISSKSEPDDIRAGMSLGADDYITKPFQRGDLIRTIKARLQRNTDYQLQRLRVFSHRVIAIQESERLNLSNILKDRLVDSLSDLKLTLDLVARLPQSAQATTIKTATSLVNYTLSEVEKLTQTLYPTTLSTIGLLPSLLLLFDKFTKDTQIVVDFEHSSIERIRNIDQTIAIYRLIQEALNNVATHANVGQVDVRLWIENDLVYFQIIDAGSGFIVDDAIKDITKTGIITMHERVNVLNGELTILSALDEGTRVLGYFPLHSSNTITSGIVPQWANRFSDIPLTGLQPIQNQSNKNKHRVVLADTNEIARWGFHTLITSSPNYAVVGQISNINGLFNILEDINFDILILSHNIQGSVENPTLIEQLTERFPNIRIVYISNENTYTQAELVIQQGAYAYLLRTCDADELLHTLDLVIEGKHYITHETAEEVVQKASNEDLDAYTTLTSREREIFHFVVSGNTSREIAEELVLSTRTVESHRLNMMRKLGIKGTSALIRFASDNNLI